MRGSRKHVRTWGTVVAVPAIVTTMVVGGSGTAVADATPTYRITADRTGDITTTLAGGTFTRSTDALLIRDGRGTIVDRVPTSIPLNGTTVALRSEVAVDGRSATVVPELTPQIAAALRNGAHPVSAAKDRAFDDMLFHVANGLNRAGTVSAAAGAGVGAVVGAAVGLVVGCSVFGACILLVPGAAVGAAVGAGVAGAAGTQYGDPRAAQSVLTWITTR